MTKAVWKWYYRQLRIARRECFKAHWDMLIYGIGFVRIKDGYINHVLPQAVELRL